MIRARRFLLALVAVISVAGPGTADPPKPRAVLTGHTDEVYALVFSPDGKTLASAGQDGSIRLWDAATFKAGRLLVRRGPDPKANHRYTFYALAFSPDGKTLASGGNDNPVELWDLETGKVRLNLKMDRFGGQAVAFTPDGKTLATGGGRRIRTWDAGTGNELAAFQDPLSPVLTNRMLTFRPDGRELAAGYLSGVVWLWDAAKGTVRSKLDTGDEHGVYSAAFSPDGSTLAVGNYDGGLQLWSVPAATKTATLTGHKGFVHSVSFSPDGKTLASGGHDETIRLWDVATATQRAAAPAGQDYLYCVAYSPDGKTLATAGSDGTIKLWDVTALAIAGK